MIRKILYGPPNWIIGKFSSEDRRMFGFWTIIMALVVTSILVGSRVKDYWWFLWLTGLSIIALIPNYAAETPVETENEQETQFETDSWPEPSVVDKLNDQEQDW